MLSEPITETPGSLPLAGDRDDRRNEGASSEPSVAVQRSAQELRQLSSQVEAFLLRQLERFEQELIDVQTQDETHYSADVIAELEAAKQLWENQRAEELARIQDDSRRLAEAWAKLEEEQREVLRQRAAQQASGGAAATSGKSTSVPTSSERARNLVAAPSGPGTVQRSAPAPAGHKNQLQFQQLRREMLEHARQRRKR